MFYIYGVDGLQFQGRLEDLAANKRVKRGRAVRAVKSDQQSEEISPENAQAIHSYQRYINRENMVEPLIHIFQIMSSPVSTIGRDIPLYDAWIMLKQSNIRQLVVTSGSRQVLGMVSDRDILSRINISDDEIEVNRDLSVSEVIADETYSTDAISDIRRVAQVMAYYHLDAMPVIESEKLAGIVTRGDILRGFAANPKLNLWA
ncbi:MAG TPA: CBS domain-containing protein [Desulfopila sp.]|nr:CBS domain-containing protein [Desulfopila sp.]